MIGGLFKKEIPNEIDTGFFNGMGSDVRFFMSGRCGIYYCLLDCKASDERRLAYLPAYTCETVTASYLKAGYSLRFYDVDPVLLKPRFKDEVLREISVLGLCGYFGFSSYDRDFVSRCREFRIRILHDITHSLFSADGWEPAADYLAGSMRKWMGIPSGGVAAKRIGSFSPPLLPAKNDHIKGRNASMDSIARAAETGDDAYVERAYAEFWETEMGLRKTFDAYESDEESVRIARGFAVSDMVKRRRSNYRFLIENAKFGSQADPVFSKLPEGVCPSHFPLYAKNRDEARAALDALGIKSTVYWPIPPEIDPKSYPGASQIYSSIYCLPIDQRFGEEEMMTICSALRNV